MSRKLAFLAGALIAFGCQAALAKSVTCTMASLKRTVELSYETAGQPVPCEVRYAKRSEGFGWQVLWRAEHEAGYCEARFDEFVDKLAGFGWSCSAGSDTLGSPVDEVADAPDEAVTDTQSDEADATVETGGPADQSAAEPGADAAETAGAEAEEPAPTSD